MILSLQKWTKLFNADQCGFVDQYGQNGGQSSRIVYE